CGRCDCRSARRWGIWREPSRRWPTGATHDGRTPTISTGQPCIAPRQPETWVAASSLSRTAPTCSRWTNGNVALWTSLAWAIR
ncbi:unnamed protein product, partial [Ectocarpus fasciculatus]